MPRAALTASPAAASPGQNLRTQARSFESLDYSVEKTRRVRQRRSDIGDREVRITAPEIGDAPPRLVVSTGQRIGRCPEAICPHRRRMLGEAAGKPACGVVVARGLEMRRGNAERAKEVQRVIGSDAARDLEPLDRRCGVAAIDADPTAAVPRPNAGAVERERP